MDEQRLAYLSAATQAGSIRGAAQKLQINASTISRQIALLEEELSVAVLERLGRGVRPTEAGQLLIEHYMAQRGAREDVVAAIHELASLTRGTVQLVAGEGFIGDLLSGPLMEFCQGYPGLALSVRILPADGIIRAITEDEAHIGLVFNPPFEARLNSVARIRKSICAIVPKGHPLTKSVGELKLGDLLAHPMASLDLSFGVQRLIAAAAAQDRLRLQPAVTTNSFTLLRKFVACGLGIALMPDFVAVQEIEEGSVSAVPIANPILQDAEIHIVIRHGRRLPPSALRLLDHLKVHLRSFGAIVPRLINDE